MADITEPFEIDLTTLATTSGTVHADESIAYDIKINEIGFILNNNQDQPYRRQTAQYRKDQNDTSLEPGEQTLLDWWLRSQSSFHYGAGLNYFDPGQQSRTLVENQTLRFMFADSQGVNVFEKGKVTLLNRTKKSNHYTTGTNKRSLRTIPQGVLLHDGLDLDRIDASGNEFHFVDYVSGADPVYSVCDDGVHAYWITNTSAKMEIWKKPLDSTSSTTAASPGDAVRLYQHTAGPTTRSTMEWVKERLVFNIDDTIYEYYPSGSNSVGGTATALITAYKFNSAGTVITDITASGSAVYVSYYNGINSAILQFSLDTTDLTLAPVGVTAELPRGEIVYSMKYYLGYVAIGTNFGVRIAQVLDNGSLVYGPLLFTSSYPCYQFAADDSYLWAACGVGTKAGLVKIDLSYQLDNLVFPYANDLVADDYNWSTSSSDFAYGVAVPVLRETTGVAFMGQTDRLAFTTPYTTSNGNIYIEQLDTPLSSGYVTTGRIRYNTLDDKLFKFVRVRGSYNGNSYINISSINPSGTETLIAGVNTSSNADQSILPSGANEYLQFKFTLTTDSKLGGNKPTFNGYQIKALPAVKRQRLIQYPLFNYDMQMDKYNNRFGYDGKAQIVNAAIESLEEIGDIVTVTDNRTDEAFDAIIEEVSFSTVTPPDKRYSGFGGTLLITVRKI